MNIHGGQGSLKDTRNDPSSNATNVSNGLYSRKKKSRKQLAEFYQNQERLAKENKTPEIAEMAALDYKLNGGRARTNTGDFIGPRWVIDQEAASCYSCNTDFNWVNRRHHCRHCGQIFCNNCSLHRDLLPKEFGLRDPQRVCDSCHCKLDPFQTSLTADIANHQRVNTVQLTPETCTMRRYTNLPFSSTLGSELRKAAYSTFNLFNSNWVHDEGYVIELISRAKGLAFLTVVKGGFIFAPRLGTGLVISRLSDGRWSGPTAIGTFGVCWGALLGADLTDYVIVLNTTEAVEAFSGTGQVSIGLGVDIAVGPVGRSGSAAVTVGDGGMAPAFSYSHSRGLFAGVSLDGSVIFSRPDVNHRFYGRVVTPAQILAGYVPSPRAAQPLYDVLYEAIASLPNPKHSVVSPTQVVKVPATRRNTTGNISHRDYTTASHKFISS